MDSLKENGNSINDFADENIKIEANEFYQPEILNPNITGMLSISSKNLQGNLVSNLTENIFNTMQTTMPTSNEHITVNMNSSSAINNATLQQLVSQLLMSNTSSASSATPTLPVKTLLIPVSSGNGVQQLVSIPLSLATSISNQMHNDATMQHQSQTLSLPSNGNGMQSLVMVGSQLGVFVPAVQNTLPAVQTAPIHGLTQSQLTQQLAQQLTQQLLQQKNSQQNSVGNLPQILASAQEQLLAIGANQNIQMLQPNLSAVHSSNLINNSDMNIKPQQNIPKLIHTQQDSNLFFSPTKPVSPSPPIPTPKQIQLNFNQVAQALINGSTLAKNSGQPVSPQAISSTQTLGITPSINRLLPPSNGTGRENSTVVDGVNLDDMREFARQFKIRRLSLGLTQTQVGQALNVTEGPSYSQSAICRFEKLDITPKSAQKIKPVLERWMTIAEERYKSGGQPLSDFGSLEPSKKKKVPTATLR